MKNMMNTMIPLTVANTLNQTAKQRIEAKPSQTLKQVVQEQKLSPEGDFDVYDQMGKVISNQSVANHRDNTVYVGVAKVAGGAIGGISRQEFNQLKTIEFPRIRHITKYSSDAHVGALVLTLPGVTSHRDTSTVFYTVLIDLRSLPALPSAYVLSPKSSEIQHSNIYRSQVFAIAPNRELSAICTGDSFRDQWAAEWQHNPCNRLMKFGVFIDHLIHVLKHPNPDDYAREV
jgi:hypothetical protein